METNKKREGVHSDWSERGSRWKPHFCIAVDLFPHFRGVSIANTISSRFRLCDCGWKNAVEGEAEVSEDERGGSHRGQDGQVSCWVRGSIRSAMDWVLRVVEKFDEISA